MVLPKPGYLGSTQCNKTTFICNHSQNALKSVRVLDCASLCAAGRHHPHSFPVFSGHNTTLLERRGAFGLQFYDKVHCLSTAKDDMQTAHGLKTPSHGQQVSECSADGETQSTSSSDQFDAMFEQLLQWKATYFNCIVPKEVYDNPALGHWVHQQRKLHKRGLLREEHVAQLDSIGFAWAVDVVTAKWYVNLHELRRYKALHGSADIPPTYSDGDNPIWVECARWLQRQHELYRKEKLTPVKLRLLKDVLGIKMSRPYAPAKKNKHPILLVRANGSDGAGSQPQTNTRHNHVQGKQYNRSTPKSTAPGGNGAGRSAARSTSLSSS